MFISHYINKISIRFKIRNSSESEKVRDIFLNLKSDQNIVNGFTLHMELGSEWIKQEFETGKEVGTRLNVIYHCVSS